MHYKPNNKNRAWKLMTFKFFIFNNVLNDYLHV